MKWIDALFLGIDRIGIFALYESLNARLKAASTRPLTSRELQVARSVYGDSVDYRPIRIDEGVRRRTRQGRICYVSFNTINSWGKISDELLIHELIHIWQYQHFGACYIPRALAAQRTSEGYNYGGLVALEAAKAAHQHLTDFNYEQQGDLIADYFRLRKGQRTRWSPEALPQHLPVYQYFVDQLHLTRKGGSHSV